MTVAPTPIQRILTSAHLTAVEAQRLLDVNGLGQWLKVNHPDRSVETRNAWLAGIRADVERRQRLDDTRAARARRVQGHAPAAHGQVAS